MAVRSGIGVQRRLSSNSNHAGPVRVNATPSTALRRFEANASNPRSDFTADSLCARSIIEISALIRQDSRLSSSSSSSHPRSSGTTTMPARMIARNVSSAVITGSRDNLSIFSINRYEPGFTRPSEIALRKPARAPFVRCFPRWAETPISRRVSSRSHPRSAAQAWARSNCRRSESPFNCSAVDIRRYE